MKVTIIQKGAVGIDGEFRIVDMADLDPKIHAVQFDTATDTGHIEFDNDLDPRIPNQPLGRSKFNSLFNRYIQRWKAVALPPERTLLQVKEDARQQINSKRDNLEQSGFPYLEKIVDSNPVSVQRITVAAQAAQIAMAVGAPFAIDWTCQDNSVLSLDGEGMLGMPVALAMFAKVLHETAREKKDLIDAAETIEEVETITWE